MTSFSTTCIIYSRLLWACGHHFLFFHGCKIFVVGLATA